ncbi:hypothetical protein HF086_018210 [Spodoptera exigua]|uniref:2Fe-2S ferredoxin-type domain-containing protein n=1 Tax=Spodoptera exigua TaxID=7107 RepID=A0A922MN75_SPOEX|nr:hypothetical protein HF086_018210 [Spodoptera exigua]
MDRVRFKINGEEYSVGCEVSSSVMLLEYIREHLELRGTKYMCRQASCGACIVTAQRPPASPYAVNSCILPITSCHGLEITTVEEIGNRKKGYHPLQTALAKYNGSQCGYCSPGWIMAMYSLLQSKKHLTKLEIEKSFGSNICRCTGFRPILDAFKTFASDSSNTVEIPDIEDLRMCSKKNKPCDNEDWCLISMSDFNKDGDILKINLKDGKVWYKAYRIADIFNVLKSEGSDSYKLICGNTAKGVYPDDDRKYKTRVLISLTSRVLVSQVKDLIGYFLDQNLVGSIAGNLMMKHIHNEFHSDLFLLFETIGAQLTISFKFGKYYNLSVFLMKANDKDNYILLLSGYSSSLISVCSNGKTQIVRMQDFLKLKMKGKLILNVMLPPLSKEHKLVTFKIMPRSQNAHAVVNSGFLYKLKPNNTVLKATITFGGLSKHFTRASATERFLVGKPLFRNDILQEAIKILKAELVVTENPPEFSAAYRKQLAVGLFYKGLLTLCPGTLISPRYKSGAIKLHETRPVSEGRQIFDTIPSLWPLNQPVPKIEGLIQCSGEAKYTDDIPTFPKEVHGAFVLSTIGKGRIVSIDPSKALSHPGVIEFYSSKDIPGLNSFTPTDYYSTYHMNEEVFCSGQVKYYNQPLGLIVALTQDIAYEAVDLVKVNYTDLEKPVADVNVAKKIPARNTLYAEFKATSRGNDVAKVVKGTNTIRSQNYISMETLVSVTNPLEDGFDVYATSQWPTAIHLMVYRALKIDQNKINVHVRRVGGAYGFKISRIVQVAVASSLVALKLNRPYTAKNTWFRSPGSLENISMVELMMEQISYELSVDPTELRLANLDPQHNDLRGMFQTLASTAEYTTRKNVVNKFNAENRWKKRGLRFVFLKWNHISPRYFDVNLAVYQADGTVAICHGGVEMGQGINTKAAQIAAYKLNIPIEKIVITETNTNSSPNAFVTGGSLTTQNIMIGVERCCDQLLERLEPIRKQLNNPSWEELIKTSYRNFVDLQTHGFVDNNDQQSYVVYGVTLAEVEIDVITGELEILRVDIHHDVGQSVNPDLDIGQVEGAFVMGLGYWTSENLVYDPNTGELLNDRTWNYYVPLARDIPQDFRVYLRKKSYSTKVIFGSKACGEPPICMSVSIPIAIREAIVSARQEAGLPSNQWFNIDGPYTIEKICLACETKTEEFKFN